MSVLFAKTCSYKDALIVVEAAPWEVTSSYGGGSALGPKNIIKASSQLDFFNFKSKKEPKHFIYMHKINLDIFKKNQILQKDAKQIIKARGACGSKDFSKNCSQKLSNLQKNINKESDKLNKIIYESSLKTLKDNKIPALLGGDHSVSFGAIKACSKKYKNFSLLHIDAHADLRKAYQGFKHSHASIMYNVMNLKTAPKKLCSVGVRDFCQEEYDYAKANNAIKIFFDKDLQKAIFRGSHWAKQCQKIISEMTKYIYVSFDIDGLQANFCPNTGTPVPGGLSYNQAIFLLEEISRQNKKIIAFDLCEVSCGTSNKEWDANIGARILFEMSLISYNQML